MLAFLLAVPLVVAAVPTSPGDLIITEIMAYPNEVPTLAGQWFEVYNPTEDTLQLAGLQVGNTDGPGFTISGSLELASGGRAVFGVNGCDDLTRCGDDYNGGVEVDYVYGQDVLYLNESGDHLYLATTIDGAIVLLDTVTWSHTEIQQDYALQVNINAHLEWANNLSTNWCSADTPYGEYALYGTPGAANQPCDGSSLDDDGDGYTEATGDCDDNDPYIHPDTIDGVGHYEGTGDYSSGEGCCGNPDDDANCDGVRDDGVIDDDGDGFTEVSGDCDDTDSATHPRSIEDLSNGIDDDCDGCVDDDDSCQRDDITDLDGDGYSTDDGDCDDANALASPGMAEVPYDGIDNDCDGEDLTDVDGDGLDGMLAGGEDCDDEDAAVGVATVWSADFDGDGFGDATQTFTSCQQPGGYLAGDGTDCDDLDPETNPGATEVACDGIDNDCDGTPPIVCEQEEPTGCQALPGAGALSVWWLSLLGLSLRRS